MFDHSSDSAVSGHDANAARDTVSQLLAGMRLRGLDYQRVQIAPPFGLTAARRSSTFWLEGMRICVAPTKRCIR
jgi:hypothetical protein